MCNFSATAPPRIINYVLYVWSLFWRLQLFACLLAWWYMLVNNIKWYKYVITLLDISSSKITYYLPNTPWCVSVLFTLTGRVPPLLWVPHYCISGIYFWSIAVQPYVYGVTSIEFKQSTHTLIHLIYIILCSIHTKLSFAKYRKVSINIYIQMKWQHIL